MDRCLIYSDAMHSQNESYEITSHILTIITVRIPSLPEKDRAYSRLEERYSVKFRFKITILILSLEGRNIKLEISLELLW